MSAAEQQVAEDQYAAGLTPSDLGFGAGFLLYGFRHCAGGHSDCARIRRGYEIAFQGSDRVLDEIEEFTAIIRATGRRRLWYAPPGMNRVTHDEILVVGAIAAAQRDDAHTLEEALRLLVSHPSTSRLAAAAQRIGASFMAQGYVVLDGFSDEWRQRDATVSIAAAGGDIRSAVQQGVTIH